MSPAMLVALSGLTMLAFAANSFLNRLAILGAGADALDFAALRLGFGAVVLVVLARGRMAGSGGLLTPRRLAGAGALLLYMIGFSLAYRSLDAGAGALILFGGVQITMFAGALLSGEAPPPRRWAGAGLALGGLGWMVAPGLGAGAPPLAALAMAAAALGWGLYSLIGRGEGAPLQATAASFVLATVPAAGLALADAGPPPGIGTLVLAALSGGVTSGLGYALWYRILPLLGASRAAVAQLTVPVIALGLGFAFLGERPGLAALAASALVLAGVALASLPRRAGRAFSR